ncbi:MULTISPECIES: hypothetical protein [Streptomyces]|uniref:Uncharacterized protein n=1 Tax=Streptomyces siderophoricus TaxID=2802281 RepID=A0ABS1MLE9_9ACTN|nr:hypothetical protein [Streptomyces sp. 9-7]MBL1088660.1 hypothetical protein [Streptomyces sp. 9-7]
MDSELTSLAQSAGTTLVTLMATDVWQRTRQGITHLWQRLHPERAELVAAQLDASREEVLAALATDDRESLDEVRAQWQGQLRRLLIAEPVAVEELRKLLDELAPASGGVAAPPVTQRATASGQARVYQAGRDQHITER